MRVSALISFAFLRGTWRCGGGRRQGRMCKERPGDERGYFQKFSTGCWKETMRKSDFLTFLIWLLSGSYARKPWPCIHGVRWTQLGEWKPRHHGQYVWSHLASFLTKKPEISPIRNVRNSDFRMASLSERGKSVLKLGSWELSESEVGKTTTSSTTLAPTAEVAKKLGLPAISSQNFLILFPFYWRLRHHFLVLSDRGWEKSGGESPHCRNFHAVFMQKFMKFFGTVGLQCGLKLRSKSVLSICFRPCMFQWISFESSIMRIILK